jgi:CheY-like chemotaxis protein
LVGDCARLRQIMINLTDNAIKFTARGEVVVKVVNQSASNGESHLHFSVTDTGIGIPAEKQAAIFEAFAQADGTTTRTYGGSGLGLSIASQLIQQMGGRIWIESEVGQGTTFHFTAKLPVCQTPAPRLAHADPPTETRGENARRLRILLAEDNVINCAVSGGILEKQGHTFVHAANGREAVDACKAGAFDLILMDVQMPEMDGFEATRLIREMEAADRAYTPIVAMTAHALVGDRERCLASGMDDYLSKPLRKEEVLRVLATVSKSSSSSSSSSILSSHLRTRTTDENEHEEEKNTTLYSREELLEQCDGDDELMGQLIALFHENTPQILEALRESIANRDAAAAAAGAHKLLSSIGAFGAQLPARSPRVSRPRLSRTTFPRRRKRSHNLNEKLIKFMQLSLILPSPSSDFKSRREPEIGRRNKIKSIAFSFSAGTLTSVAQAGVELAPSPSPPPEPRFKIYGWVESGITFNPDDPKDRQNFGSLFGDRSNEPLLNQAVITLERTLPTGLTAFDWGFKLQGLFGADARWTHSLGLLDNTMHETVQPDVLEAYLALHLPILSAGGVDLKLGKFTTLEGAETIYPRSNFFYSHSYIFNFGIPFNHTGALAIWHATSQLDLCGGVTRRVNTSIEDNNDALAFHGGVGLTLFDGKLTALATTHIGPETPNNNHDNRYLNDLAITAKVSKNLTSITDLNYIYDKAADATGYGMAQSLVYTINDTFSVGGRGEIWRDEDGFYVTSFAANDDANDALRGGAVTLDRRTVGGGSTTYGAVTIGVNIKPPVPKPASSLVIRPELRFDRSLNDTTPFIDSSERNQFTAGIDVIIGF